MRDKGAGKTSIRAKALISQLKISSMFLLIEFMLYLPQADSHGDFMILLLLFQITESTAKHKKVTDFDMLTIK